MKSRLTTKVLAAGSAREVIALALAAVALAAVAVFVTATPRQAYSAGNSAPLAGYVWSDTIGWIDLNCSNTSVCGSNPFGMSVASDGTVSGYAWSDNIGWVSANAADTSTCGSQAQLTGTSFTGWLRALSGGTSQSGGWNGCISLSGSGYGVTRGVSGALSGYAWGDTNLGWMDFSKAQLIAACPAQNMCVGNTYSYQDQFCQISPVKTCSASCTPSGCSEDATPPTGSIRALPNLVANGHSTQIVWTSDNATSCEVDGANGDSWTGISGSATSSPITDTVTYTLSCKDGDVVTLQESVDVKVYIAPVYHEI